MKRLAERATITSSIAAIFLVALLVLAFGGRYVADLVRDHSVEKIAEGEARRDAELAFQSMYMLMRRGWSRQDMDEVAASLAHALPDVELKVIRSWKVAALYGEAGDSAELRREPLVAQVLATGREATEHDPDRVRFLFPVVVEKSCLACHANVRPGDINGVVDVALPTHRLRAPLDMTIEWTLGIFGVVILLLLAAMFLALRFLIVRPVSNLSGHIEALIQSGEIKPLGNGNCFCPSEVRHLTSSFNRLLGDLDKAHRQLEELAVTDPLTGLVNRRRLAEVLTIEGERSRRYGRALGLIIVDLNDFKPVNDVYGHEAGDTVLCHVAELLREQTRQSDFVCRVGGDEFLILAPDTNGKQGLQLVAKLRAAFGASPAQVGEGVAVTVSASFGIASYPEDGAWPEDLFSLADERMYVDKAAVKAGR